ncbi:kelch domain-containing protein [Plasmodium brasilianum]|uniref:Kelch domain-containing protein n=2 Tax=Plasmodium (Plasmodium) TaxID=418103 RepID=A0A1A8W1R5_PLAMA|nr:kelch domain-containing protein [Plasmodium brasilianum]SBS85589.1 kelch domain-containing protein [Plasmodium malariae]
MPANRFLNTKTEDSYIGKLTHDTIIFGENLFKVISKTFSNNKSITLNEYTDDNIENISFCSEVLPFYCKSEIIHKGNIFNVRFGHACIFYKNNIYIYGGNQHIKNFNPKTIQFNVDTQVFKVVEEKKSPQIRYYATLNVIHSSEYDEECFFLFGGKRGKYITNDTYIFRLSNDSWEHIKLNFSPPPIFGHVSFMYKNIIFIHGGNMGNLHLNSNMWSYFEEEKKWVKILSKDEYYNKGIYKPSGRFFHSCAVCISNQGNDVKAYIFGGLNNQNKCVEDLFWSYSLNNGKWSKIENSYGKIPVERYGHSSTVLNDRWFVLFGGYNFSWYSKTELLDIHAYDINLNTWASLNVYGMPLVTHHFYGNIIQVDNSGYFFVFGGLRNNEACSKIYKFIPLLSSPYFKILRDKLEEMGERMLHLENYPRRTLSPIYSKEIKEIKNSLSDISFTLVRYIQLTCDINEKIKISNELSKNNYSYLSEKMEHNSKHFDSLVNRVEQLSKGSLDYSFQKKEDLSNEDSCENILKDQNVNFSPSCAESSEINYEQQGKL